MIDIGTEPFQKGIQTARNIITDYQSLQIKYHQCAESVNIMATLIPGLHIIITSGQVIICVPVSNMKKDISPVLDILESILDIEFDKNYDQADLAWRQFTASKAPWIRVDAEIKADSPDCKKVIVGYEQTPKYEIHCAEENTK